MFKTHQAQHKKKPALQAYSILVMIMVTLNIAEAKSVVLITIDGLYGPAIQRLGGSNLPNYYRLIEQGASTLHARSDPNNTRTLPNHTSILTGLNVMSELGGHGWSINNDDDVSVTIHSNAGRYIPSIYDVVHDAGGSTALFASKDKFSIFTRSWGGSHGQEDISGEDNGPNKIDLYVSNTESSSALVSSFINDLTTVKRDFYLLHIRNPDSAGHGNSWNLEIESNYAQAIIATDKFLGSILSAIDNHSKLLDTHIILTSDHGGEFGSNDHPFTSAESHATPLIIWGNSIEPGDIYNRTRCSIKRPIENSVILVNNGPQPIRNSDAAKLSVELLGLPQIHGTKPNNIFLRQADAPICNDENFIILPINEAPLIIVLQP